MSYAGDLTPEQCFTAMREDQAILIDVRTRAEWAYVGFPLVEEGMMAPVFAEWQIFPQMEVDPGYVAKLEQYLTEAGVSKDAKLCFLCRSGVRSLAAARATTSAGYTNCFNIVGGFEGDPDDMGHRGNVNGWKADGLPWRQN